MFFYNSTIFFINGSYNKWQRKNKWKNLKKYILKELEHFFLELGTGHTFVGSKYKLSYDNKNYYVDLLLFNYKLNGKINMVNA